MISVFMYPPIGCVYLLFVAGGSGNLKNSIYYLYTHKTQLKNITALLTACNDNVSVGALSPGRNVDGCITKTVIA